MAKPIVSVKVEGLKAIEKALTEQLPAKAGRRVIQRALRKASQPMLKQARATVSRRSGALAMSLRAWNDNKGKARYRATVHIGPKRSWKKAIAALGSYYNRSFKAATVGIYHGHIIEFGATLKSGGTIPASPYLGPAIATQGQGTIKRFGQIMGDEIEKEAERIRRRQLK